MTCECRQWKARAEHAEERLRHVAAIFRIPDGARYLNDVREHAEMTARHEAEREGMIAALDSLETILFGDNFRRSRDELEARASEAICALNAARDE